MKQVKKIEEKQKNNAKKSKIKKVKTTETNEIVKLFQILFVVILIFVFFVLITHLINNKDKNEEENKETEIQYSEIMVGSIWSQKGNYYVLLGNSDDEYLPTIDIYISNYIKSLTEEDEEIGYYVSNLDTIFNKGYISEESNIFTDNHSEVRFKGLTLIFVKEGKIVEAYEGSDEILNYVKGLE